MRLAVVSPGYPPDVGGLERHVGELARALSQLRIDVEVWTHAVGAGRPTSEHDGDIVVRRFPATHSHRFAVSPALWRHARNHASTKDILHVHGYHASAALAGLTAPRGTPLVFTPHFHGTGHTAAARLLHGPYRIVGARLLMRSDRLVAVSNAERALLISRFPAVASRCQVIHNAVNDALVHAAVAWPSQPPTVLVLGRLERYKRVDQVMRAFSGGVIPGQLVVIGDGPDRARLVALRDQLPRRGDISFLGRVTDEELGRWLVSCRTVISLSEHEAFGLVALEALAAGADAILSDIPAHREVQALAGPRVRVVDTGGSDAVAELLDHDLASERGSRLVVRTWLDAAREHQAIFQEVLQTWSHG